MEQNNTIKKDTIRLVSLSFCVVLCLTLFMVYSPLSYQYDMPNGLTRGDNTIFGTDVLYTTLEQVDSAIAAKNAILPLLPYFDRYYSAEEQIQFHEYRDELYELRWQQIQMLQKQPVNRRLLKKFVRRYSRLIGYHQAEAKQLLDQLKSKDR